jgi:hypothetical protein
MNQTAAANIINAMITVSAVRRRPSRSISVPSTVEGRAKTAFFIIRDKDVGLAAWVIARLVSLKG